METYLLDLVINKKKITIISLIICLITIVLMQIRGVHILESISVSGIILVMFFIAIPISKVFFDLSDRNRFLKKKVLFQFAKFNFYTCLIIAVIGFFYISMKILLTEDPLVLNGTPILLGAAYGSALYIKGYKSVL